MTELLSSEDVRSDPELIALVRGGDRDAYGQLYQRHVVAANRLARQLARGSDADDLVSEAFTKVMLLLQAGQGPDVAFRAYLLTAVRRLHVDRVRGEARLTTSDDMTAFDPGIPFQDTAVNQFESGAAARAFASLPERWQLVLWHLEVEGQKPADIAPLLGMSPNSVSALAYRAREGLRQAFLSAHLRETDEATCRWVTENLGSYVRKGLSRRDSTKIDAHLRECRSCTAMYLELAEVNSNLAGVIAPLLLGGLAAGYLASVPGGSAGGALILWDKVKDFTGANGGATTVGAAAATVAAVAIAATLLGPADEVSDNEPIADSPASTASSDRTAAPPAQRRPGSRDAVATRRAGVPAPRSAGEAQQQTAAPAEDLPTTEALLEAAVDEVVDVVDPEPPAGGPDGSTLAIAGASLDDEALSLTLSGVSSQARDVVVRMTSGSGQVWFASQGSPCEIDPRDTAHCRLGTLARVGTAGNSAWSRTVPLVESSTESLRLPIEYPASLEEDEVTVSIRLPGAAQDEVVDSLTLTFRPSRPGGGPTDPTTAVTDPTDPTTGVTDPTDPTTGVTDPTDPTDPTTGVTDPTDPTTAVTDPTDPTTGVTDPTDPTTGVTDPTDPTTGVTDPTDPTTGVTDPTDPTTGVTDPTDPTTGTTDPTGTGSDIALSLSLRSGTAQVRVTVDGLPVAHDRRTLVIEVASDGVEIPLVPLDRLCELDGPGRLVCETSGLVEHTDLRLDTGLLAPGEAVTLTFTAALVGEDDPDPSDNSARLSINDEGEIGIEGQLGFTRIVLEAAEALQSSLTTLPVRPVRFQPTEQPTTLVALEPRSPRDTDPSPSGTPTSVGAPTAPVTGGADRPDATAPATTRSPQPTDGSTSAGATSAPTSEPETDRSGGDDAGPATTTRSERPGKAKAHGKAKGHSKHGKGVGKKLGHDKGKKVRRHGRH